jgi:uncharacterized membrane protein
MENLLMSIPAIISLIVPIIIIVVLVIAYRKHMSCLKEIIKNQKELINILKDKS